MTFAAFEYRETLRHVITDWKFNGYEPWGPWLGRRLVERIEDRLETIEFDLLIPIPLHPERFSERGFNQARQLAGVLGEAFDIPCFAGLKKVRKTDPQAALSREQRLENLDGAFSVPNPSRISGRRILVVDDIFTTGSTLRTAAAELRDHGALDTAAAVLARAV